ncbi:MAG TPA: carboxypeptidase-like regulatory domain-containing protein, partial [Planctomycetaceae bacterium]
RGVPGSVRVVDQEARPVAKAGIVASPDWGYGFFIGPTMPQSTDENGFWKSEHLADVPYRVSVHAAGFTPVEATESNKITKVPLVITLEPAKPVFGTVVDSDGKPVEKATVRVISEKRGNSSHYHGDSGNVLAESRADGTFELSELAPGTEYGLLIDAGDRGHAALTNVRVGVEPMRVVLQKKLVLAGEVRGDVSQLETKGSITITCSSNPEGTVSRWMSAKLDDEGRFRFESLFAGKYQMTIGTHVINGRLDESVNDLVVDLAKLEQTSGARDVEIRFAENGKPVVPGGNVTAQMEVLDSHGQQRFGGSLPIVDGVLRLRMKTPGTLRLVAFGCQGYWFADFDAQVPAGADPFQAQLAVLPAGAIRVKVVAPDDRSKGRDRPGASVQFQHQTPQGMRRESFSQNSASSDEVVLAPVPLDVPCLVSASEGFRIGYVPIVTLDGAEPVRELTIELPKAVDAIVRVESVDGQPLPDIPIEVSYEPPPPPRGKVSGDLFPGAHGWGGDRQTNRSGQTILAGMPENGIGYTVIAQPKRDWQTGRTAVQTDGGVTVLKLERGKVIEGRVVDKQTGRPVPGIEVRARPAGRPLGGF